MPDLDLACIFRALLDTFGERVEAVRAEQWGAPTPNASWDVADLVGHMITELRWVDPLMRGLTLDAAAAEVDTAHSFMGIDGVGATYTQAWIDASALASAAFSASGALEGTVSLTRGEAPAHGYIRELIFDLTVHSWDLGRAIDFPGALPDDIVTIVWDRSHQFGDLSASGMFDRPVEIPDDAPVLDRLIAFTGRDPR